VADGAPRLDDQLCFALYAASRATVQAYQPLLAALGLTYPQYLVMLVLWEEDGASVGRLGERLELDSGTLTPLLKRLEGQGMVERRRSADDERVVHVHLTAPARRLARKAAEVPGAVACKAGISREEAKGLHDQLRQITKTLRGDTAGRKGKSR
jgi:MarR family transcriptional regulator, organic hydroperoxide resistance regulator